MNNISRLPSAGPLNLPLGVVRPPLAQRYEGEYTTTTTAVLEQLADLRVELVALRSLLDVGLELLAADVPLADVARFLSGHTHAHRHSSGCHCALHARKVA